MISMGMARRRLRRFWPFLILYSIATFLYKHGSWNSLLSYSIVESKEIEMRFLKSRNYSRLWEDVNFLMKEDTLYPEDFNVDFVLNVLRTAKIVKATIFRVNTSYKMMLGLEGGAMALFKPQLVQKKDKFTQCNVGCEHVEYEVAGFALNRLLKLRNMPFVSGRVISWDSELEPVATDKLLAEVKRDGNAICIHHYCLALSAKESTRQRFCFDHGLIPGAMIYFLPHDLHWPDNYLFYNVWNFKYRNKSASLLPGDTFYCQKFRKDKMYKQDKWFADVTDLAVTDFIMSHLDSRHFYIRGDNKEPLMNVVIDYGRAFCPHASPIRTLAPVTQCCKIRKKVYEALLQYKEDFNDRFIQLTKDDPLFPVLDNDLLSQILPRIRQILAQVDYCVAVTNLTDVLLDL